jgi:ABC-2 type transport system permease protein
VSIVRNPRALVFNVAFPIVLLVLFSAILATGDNEFTDFQGGRIRTATYFTAGIIAYAVMMSAFSTLTIGLTTQREAGMLKRLRGTPMPAWTFLTAQIVRSILLVAVMVIVLMVIGGLAYDVSIPTDTLPGFIIYLVLGTATMCALGLALTSVTSSAEVASTVAPFSAVILSFISGVFIPTSTLPEWLVHVGEVFPLAHLAEGLQNTLFHSASGIGLSAENVIVLAAWCLGSLIVAARLFKWEPQSSRG